MSWVGVGGLYHGLSKFMGDRFAKCQDPLLRQVSRNV